MIDTYEKCSCGKRDRVKCVEENGLEGGKMCLSFVVFIGGEMKSNGCNEDGWDLFEEQTRQQFEYYACRQGYSLVRNSEYSFFYAEPHTEDAWRMYHKGHVDGRTWGEK